MARIVWTPWRDLNEILAVRSQLYPSAGNKEPDLRRKACAQVRSRPAKQPPLQYIPSYVTECRSQISAWKLRGNLPHAVESTWFLIDAVLTDNVRINKATPLAVRQCYSTAFCR